jgi:hypothetical protein
LVAIAVCWLAFSTGLAPIASAQEPSSRQVLNPTTGRYRSDRLGFEFELVPYRGHFGARLTGEPTAASPLRHVATPGGEVYLEVGDMIIGLDGQVIDQASDFDNHVAATKIDYVNVQNGQVESGVAQFPGQAPDAGGAPPATGQSNRVHAILIVDTLSKLAGLDGDKERILSIIQQIPANRRTIQVLDQARARADVVLQSLRGLGDVSSDTVLIYYSGHGATDPTRGHALTFTQKPYLFRSTLRGELQRMQPRLGVILSDCCSNVVKLPPSVGAPMADPEKQIVSLLLRTSGIVDINGSTFNPSSGVEESAWAEPSGGLFTKALFETIWFSDFDSLDSNHDGLVTWAEVLPNCESALAAAYGDFKSRVLANPTDHHPRTIEGLRNQPSQTPQAFALDGRTGTVPTGFVARRSLGIEFLGVTVFDPDARQNVFGARVQTVAAGRPGALAGLEVGDIITAVNGHWIRDNNDFLNALQSGGPDCRLRVRNVRDGTFVNLNVSFGR